MLVILAWLMFSLHVIFCDSAGDLDSNTPCGQTTQVANICQVSEIANTPKAFVYILNSPGQNKRTCTCSLSPTSSNVKIELRYRKQTRSTENINLKINDFAFDTNHINTTTVLSEIKELVLNTNPVFNKSEEVCLLITAVEEDRRFNISCDYPTSDGTDSDTNIVDEEERTFNISSDYPTSQGTDSDTNIVGDSNNSCGKNTPVANICHISEKANTSNAFVYILNSPGQNKRTCTCSLSPTSPNVKIHLRYRELTRSTENINLKINDFTFDTNHINTTTVLTERNELVLNTNPVLNKSEEVCLLITAVEGDRKFNISCDYPTSTSDSTDSGTHIIGVVIGCAIVGVIVIVMVVLNIVILKRKANKKRKIKKTPKLSQEENGAATRNAEDDNDYYMTENPMYNMFEPTMDKNEIPEYALVHKHEPTMDKNETPDYALVHKHEPTMDKNEIPEYALVHKHAPNDEQQNMEDYDDNPKPGIYDCIPDSTNDVSQPLVSEQTDENNVHK